MTTFKNNAKYAELVFTYLELAEKRITPVDPKTVLEVFAWQFKGGSLFETSKATRLAPETSLDVFPHGSSDVLAQQWPSGEQCAALRTVVMNRLTAGRLRNRAVMARLGTYLALTHSYGNSLPSLKIYSGMKAIYKLFGEIWSWSERKSGGFNMETLGEYTKELMFAMSASSKVHLPTAEGNRREYWDLLEGTRIRGLLRAVLDMKEIIRMAGSRQASTNARQMGMDTKPQWECLLTLEQMREKGITESPDLPRMLRASLGPLAIMVYQGVALWGTGEVRFALSKSDMERLHQLLMSSASALVGVCAQAAVGTKAQREKARTVVEVTERNIQRIARSSQLVQLGDEVLVCKGYRRAYTAHLGVLAGPLCSDETKALIKEAEETAPKGVLDVEGMLYDLRTLDAAGSLNAAKMYKICPAPDVSPGQAMMDRIEQIGNGNTADPEMMVQFEGELRTQILRAYIRSRKVRLELRDGVATPEWYSYYQKGEYEKVPSIEIHKYLAWEGTAEMPETSPFDAKHWKDSGLGADTIAASRNLAGLGKKSNMITRLIFDEECPMPGRIAINEEHVIKFFTKAEGHKDPARGIFSSNLADRQAQSWMERGVEKVAVNHPSFMIGQEIDVKEAKIAELTARPARSDWVALYYSFDISGWSAKMPGEPQRISHSIWRTLYGGHVFNFAEQINEGAHIYLNIDGYVGWFRNTHANLEGFNGKEMTMVLIALLSLSVTRWRVRVVEEGILSEDAAMSTTALLFAYIDDGLCRIDLPKKVAVNAFKVYKEMVIETFDRCGFSVEVSKCFPSDRFAIFLNEVYLAGRHVVHGVRAAMGISAEQTERHTSLVERVTTVATGVRGAVMAGLSPLSASFLLAYHTFLHFMEWVPEKDPVVLTTWAMLPRSWGGLGFPNLLQTFVSGSGAAFEESVATMQCFARVNDFAKRVFINLCKTELAERSATGVLTAPLSGRIEGGYMVDTRVAGVVRNALRDLLDEGDLSTYAHRLLKYADDRGFHEYAECVIPIGCKEVLQEQMVDNVAEAHPHTIFSAFARRLEKSMTVRSIVGRDRFNAIIEANRREARESVGTLVLRAMKM